jgi:hypothetical protein
VLHEGYDDEVYLNTLEAEARSWAERYFADDAAQIARAVRTRAAEMCARRGKDIAPGAAAAPARPDSNPRRR